MPSHSVAIVLDGDQRSALAAVRSLGRRNIIVHVAEAHPRSLAASSRYCRSALTYPDPATRPDDFCQWLADLDKRFPEAVLLPMTDVTVPLVLLSRPQLNHLRTALPSLKSYEAVSDKYFLFESARRAGISVPLTVVVSQGTLNDFRGTQWRYPVVVKPRRSTMRTASGMHKRSVRYANDNAELLEIVKGMLLDSQDELLVQEYVAGYGAGVFGLYAHGQPLYFFSHRRIREKPPSGGVSVLCESVPLPPRAVSIARQILDVLDWHGVAMVEFKIDAHGEPRLIEINARFWGSLQLAVDCGVDFPWFVYEIALGMTPTSSRDYVVGNRLRWWLGDLDNLYARLRDRRSTPTVRSKISAVTEFLLPLRRKVRHEIFRWDDPAPALVSLYKYIYALGNG